MAEAKQPGGFVAPLANPGGGICQPLGAGVTPPAGPQTQTPLPSTSPAPVGPDRFGPASPRVP